jgi:hypothetical protein
MADVIQPAALNERFPVYLNADGRPVERTLREMTADEVIAAVEWSAGVAERLACEAMPAEELIVAVQAGHGELLNSKTRQELEAGIAALDAASKAIGRHAHLLKLIRAAVPQWQEQTKRRLHEAVRRYWPRPVR